MLAQFCAAGNHMWVTTGAGRPCPVEFDDCSEQVYRCHICGELDYGGPGSVARLDCEQCSRFKDAQQSNVV